MIDDYIVFERRSGKDSITLSYFPGMVCINSTDVWNDLDVTFNVSMADWRAMNVAIENKHGGVDE